MSCNNFGGGFICKGVRYLKWRDDIIQAQAARITKDGHRGDAPRTVTDAPSDGVLARPCAVIEEVEHER